MLTVSPIKNVKYTLNNQLTFRAGEQTNYGVTYIPKQNIIERSFFANFAGIIKDAFAKLNPKAASRAESIREGIEETKKLNKVA